MNSNGQPDRYPQATDEERHALREAVKQTLDATYRSGPRVSQRMGELAASSPSLMSQWVNADKYRTSAPELYNLLLAERAMSATPGTLVEPVLRVVLERFPTPFLQRAVQYAEAIVNERSPKA